MFSFLVLVVALSLYKHFDYKVSGEGGKHISCGVQAPGLAVFRSCGSWALDLRFSNVAPGIICLSECGYRQSRSSGGLNFIQTAPPTPPAAPNCHSRGSSVKGPRSQRRVPATLCSLSTTPEWPAAQPGFSPPLGTKIYLSICKFK